MSAQIRVIEASFVGTAVTQRGYPDMNVPEVAFVGRSNVGKSSMINALTGRRKLVRVSKTPGRTRTLNFFLAALERGGYRHSLGLVDLPGYGFARVAKDEHARWDAMVVEYFKQRAALKMIVLILDAEIGATQLDEQTLRYLQEVGRPVIVVGTKADRLSKSRRKPQLVGIAKALGLKDNSAIAFSSTDGFGVSDVLERIWSHLFA